MKADSIRVDAGQKRILINEDPTRVVEFNPSDVLFAKKFYALLGDFDQKNVEFQKRLSELDEMRDKDKFGLPKNLPDSIGLANEMADYLHEQIDNLFGDGTSEAAFQGQKNLEMIEQFFTGLLPYIQRAREEKIEKYTKPAKKR